MNIPTTCRFLVGLQIGCGFALSLFLFLRNPYSAQSSSASANIVQSANSARSGSASFPPASPTHASFTAQPAPQPTREELLLRLETAPAATVEEARQHAALKPSAGEFRARYYEGPATLRLATICHGYEDGSAHAARCGSHAVLELPDGSALFAHHASSGWQHQMNESVHVQTAIFEDQAAVVLPTNL